MLAPRFWEPCGESWKNWVSARILRETGEFTVAHHGPLYNLYLQMFLFLDYPLSFQLEHIVTRLFVVFALFVLLRKVLPPLPALILTCSWIPTLWITEAGATPLGIGLFSLYLAASGRSKLNSGYLPVPLAAAALVHTAYIPFLLGHGVGTFLKQRWQKRPVITRLSKADSRTWAALAIKGALVLLAFSAWSLQSTRPDNNVHAFIYPWSPIPSSEILTVGSLQIGNWKYVMRTEPKSQWIYKDWYFTHKEAFGDSQTLWRAALNKPAVFFTNMAENLTKGAIRVPLDFFLGFRFKTDAAGKVVGGVLLIMSWLLTFLGFPMICRYFKSRHLNAHPHAISLGTTAAFLAISLVWFIDRYVIVLLPVGLLLAAHAGRSFQLFLQAGRPGTSEKPTGYDNTQSTFTLMILLVMAVSVLATSFNPFGPSDRTKDLLGYESLLAGKRPVSMKPLHEHLAGRLKPTTKILAHEAPWIRSFEPIDIDHIHHPLILPPFKDASGKTEQFLSQMDMICVSHHFSTREPSVATQVYLRYLLHVAPFLEKALKQGWTEEKIQGYGSIYHRPEIH